LTPRQAVEEFCCRTIDLVAADVAIVKPQVALFERLGQLGRWVIGNHAASLLQNLSSEPDSATSIAVNAIGPTLTLHPGDIRLDAKKGAFQVKRRLIA